MDALVSVALAKVNELVGRIFELQESDYSKQEDLCKLRPVNEILAITYDEAVSEAIAKAIRAGYALRAALRVLEPENL